MTARKMPASEAGRIIAAQCEAVAQAFEAQMRPVAAAAEALAAQMRRDLYPAVLALGRALDPPDEARWRPGDPEW